MIEALALLGGLALLWMLFVVRQFAAIRFPQMTWRAAPGARAPAAWAEQFAAADAELAALGFRPHGWMVLADAANDSRNLLRLHIHPDSHALASLQAPVDPAWPHRLVPSFVHHYSDGTSRASFRDSTIDAFFSTPRQQRRSFPAADLAALWRAHQAWHTQAAIPVEPIATVPRDRMAALSTRHFLAFVDELLAVKMLRRDRSGGLRLRLGTLPRFFAALRRAPKPPVEANAPAPARERALLPLVERLREQAPSRGMQLALLATTTVLFALLGGLLWSIELASLLAAALLLHEGGHYLAMRLLGYRHVQMVLLPLLGGVTTGVESDPRGTHRAIVSLMGPLPGILLGWALLVFALGAGGNAWLPAASILLILNYLNLLPVPPLDGGHFLQSLLPRRWVWVETLVSGLLVLAGILFAVVAGWWLLLILVGLQVLALRTHFRDARLAARIRREIAPQAMSRPLLDGRLVDAVADEDPGATVVQRLARVLRLRTLLLLKPPHLPARALLLGVYAALFVLPLVASPTLRDMARLLAHASMADTAEPVADRRADERRALLDAQRAASATLTLPQLLTGIEQAASEPDPWGWSLEVPPRTPAGAPPDEAAFATAEARLDLTLPADYRALARAPQRDLLGLFEPDQLVTLGEGHGDWLDDWTGHGQYPVTPLIDAGTRGTEPAPLERAQLAHAIALASPIDGELLAWAPMADPCCRILDFTQDGALAYADLRAWLVGKHVARTLEAEEARAFRHARERALADSASFDLATLLAVLEAQAEQAAHRAAAPAPAPAPASLAAIEAASRRVGALPDDYRAVLALHDGLPAFGLLPIAEVALADATTQARWFDADMHYVHIDAAGAEQGWIDTDDVAGASLIIAGWPGAGASVPLERRAMILLLRAHDEAVLYLDLRSRRAHASLVRLLRERLAEQQAITETLE